MLWFVEQSKINRTKDKNEVMINENAFKNKA